MCTLMKKQDASLKYLEQVGGAGGWLGEGGARACMHVGACLRACVLVHACVCLRVPAVGSRRQRTTRPRRARRVFTTAPQVRQHMSRLPSIDPAGRSLLLCGYPNVGKSSLMNKLTRADVEVQPYAFTTKALYVGHLDYKYLRWQVGAGGGGVGVGVGGGGAGEVHHVGAFLRMR